MFGRATIRLGIGPHSSFFHIHSNLQCFSGLIEGSVRLREYCIIVHFQLCSVLFPSVVPCSFVGYSLHTQQGVCLLTQLGACCVPRPHFLPRSSDFGYVMVERKYLSYFLSLPVGLRKLQ